MIIDVEDGDIVHYGIIRRSGRYPWGSGSDENTHNRNFVSYVSELRKKGLTDTEITKALGYEEPGARAKFNAENSVAKNQQRQALQDQAWRLHEAGVGNTAAAREMGIAESTFRSLIARGKQDQEDTLTRITDMLREEVDSKGLIDVGSGNEIKLGITSTRLKTAIARLELEGYESYTLPVRQVGTGKETKMKVLAKPGTTWGEARKNQANVQLIQQYSHDGGRTFDKVRAPLPLDPKRVGIVYGAEGAKADGVMYVRPGVKDLSLGGNNYAQVRIQVGPGHYLKGMAVLKDDLPDGVDVLFHTPKADTGNKLDAMKALKDDPDLPFGAIVRQIGDNLDTPKGKVTSVMNVVNDTGDWEKWSRTLSSQMLSKQDPKLAKGQLEMTYERRQQRFNEIMALTNPTVRRKMLEEFAESVDTASVHLKAAALPGQTTHVILPISSIKPTDIFAPNYPDGTTVALVRFPHGGTFEIPELRVNNKNREAAKLLGKDQTTAVGIHHTVAQRLSGADFDGDTVLVIPNNRGSIKTSPALEGLKDFDPVAAYPKYPGMKVITNMQTEMGKVSNLITDMTIRGASQAEIARAIRHSMVIIDSEKKELNHRQSYIDNGIKNLKDKYQRAYGSDGASTLISRAKSREDVPAFEPRKASRGGPIDPATGKKVFELTGEPGFRKDKATGTYVPTGGPRLVKAQKLAITDDAFTLSSGTRIEAIYAVHSNQLKALADRARLESIRTPHLQKSKTAPKVYATQVKELEAALALAKENAPRERQAQIIAGVEVKAKRDANPNLEKKEIKKIESRALTKARARTGAKKEQIRITPEQWEAIQAGAISDSKLTDILRHADMDVVNELATPKNKPLMTSTMTARAERMLDQGYTREEVASHLGVSMTTLDVATK